METLKNSKGFTLIELLAVIVVLAIVIALATNTVLPAMTDARKNVFVNEATAAIETASNIINLYDLNVLEKPKASDDYQKGTSKYCFTLKYLADTGYFKKDASYFEGDSPEYSGKVIVDMSSGGTTNKYTYTITMHNDLYKIEGTSSTIKASNVTNYSGAEKYTCTSTDVE